MQPDLTFYPHLAGGSAWSRMPGEASTPPTLDTWFWAPAQLQELELPGTLDVLDALHAAGWRNLGEWGEGVAAAANLPLLELWGQLGHVRLARMPGHHGAPQVWAEGSDLERVERVPVALTFTSVPPKLAAQAKTARTPAGQPGPIKVLAIAETLPPPQIGELGFVRAELDGQRGWRYIPLDALGEAGSELQQRLAAAIRALAGELDSWQPITPALVSCVNPGYRQVKSAFQSRLLSTRGKAREDVRAALAELETAQKLYHAMQTARNWCSRESWLARWEEIRQMAQQLATMYWEAQLAQVALAAAAVDAKAKESQIARRLPAIPNIFGANEHAAIPSALPVLDVLTSYSHGQRGTGWASDDVGYPTYIHATEQHNTAIQVRPETPTAVLDDITIQSLWQQVKAFTDLDGDVFLAMIAQAMMVSPDEEGYVWITGGAILEYRGIKPITKREGPGVARRAGNRQEDLIGIAQCIARQASQWVIIRATVRADDSTGSGKSRRRGKTRKYTHESRLTQVAEVIRQHELNPEEGAEAQQTSSFPIAWKYRMGTWLTPFLKEPNRQVAWLCQRALRYDPYHEQWEKRLARYYMIHLRINAAGGAATIPRVVGKLLAELGLPVDERNPQKTKDRWEKAHRRLVADGVIDAWEYAAENPALPARHWLETFLEWRVQVSAASMPAEKYAQIAEHARMHRTRAKHLAEGHEAEGATPDE